MKELNLLYLILILGLFLFFTGCIETGSNKISHGSSSVNVTIVEHTYLFGNEGFFLTQYDIKESFDGNVTNEGMGLNRTQMAVILNKYLD